MPEVVRLPVVPHRERISFSEWQLFKNNCQWRWFLDHLEGRKSDIDGPELMFGDCIHQTLERQLGPEPVIPEAPNLTVEEAKLFFSGMLAEGTERLQRMGLQKPFSPEEMLVSGHRIIEDISKLPLFQDATFVKNEHRLYQPMARRDGNLGFKGFIDVLFTRVNKRGQTVLYLADYKSCSWGWSYQKRTDKDVHAQPLLYKHFLCKELDLNPKLVKCGFILLKKKPKAGDLAVEYFDIGSSEARIKEALDSIQSDVTRMRSGLYARNRQSCSNRWGDRCPYLDTEHCVKYPDGITDIVRDLIAAPREGAAQGGHDVEEVPQEGLQVLGS
jgi:hypothetical protein